MSDIEDVYPGPNNPEMFEEKMSDTNNAKESTGNERLPEQQCPVRVAENDLIAEQIARDAEKWSILTVVDGVAITKRNDVAVRDHIDGRLDQDKIATNRTVEAAISAIMKLYPSGYLTTDVGNVIKELEKLRRV